MCVCVFFTYWGPFLAKLLTTARTYIPHGDQRPIQIKQNMMVPAKFKGKVKDSVRHKLVRAWVWVRLYR